MNVVSEYKEDLSNYEIAGQEICLRKRQSLAQNEESRPSTLAASLKEWKENRFPNLYLLLKIGCTLPVSSCEWERSFSAMGRLRTWLRTSMPSQRLSPLAVMNIHRNDPISYTEIVKKFLILYPRKFNCANLFFFRKFRRNVLINTSK